ncbi:MAG: rRNA maturation RNase YbeY [Lachnospiraceae bacterium]|nr:rRNA maturation RNase YbeY [Lachnospiraceae bacterium]
MTFYVEADEGIKDLGIDSKKVFEKVAEAVLEYMKCPYECEVSLTLTDDEAIREMNARFRDIDRATDVLSFPMIDFMRPADYSNIDEGSADMFDPENGELILGDIVISVDHVILQAKEYGHSIMREFAFLVTHSMLHLLGFDHIEPDDAAIMEKTQDDILNKLDIRRQS